MRALPWLLALFIVSLAACKGQPHATSPDPAPPAAADPPAGMQHDAAAPIAQAPDQDLPEQGQPCPDETCKDGLTCVTYYGIAGSSGPRFASCEIPCAKDAGACPQGQQCVTIADGPGRVCQEAF